MSLQEALRTKRLKSTATKERSAPQKLLCENDEQYKQLMEETMLETYFDVIRHLTFASTFITFGKKEARSTIALHQLVKNEQLSSAQVHEAIEADAVLKTLAQEISVQMLENNWSRAFVRLSTRSPKDAALSTVNFGQRLRDDLDYVKRLEGDVRYDGADNNRKLHALYRSSTSALAVENGVDAVALLVESARIQDDLALYVSEDATTYDSMQLCIREFKDFHPDFEFRAFVYNHRLTAVTQYNDMIFFPHLNDASLKTSMLSSIQTLFEELDSKLTLKNYVLDLVFVPVDSSSRSIDACQLYVIELNPLAEFAGTGLFSWEVAHDRRVLLGDAPFEFRIVEEVPTNSMQSLPSNWKKVLNDLS